MIDALHRADEEKSANVMVLSGAGDKAFCTGDDQKVHMSEDGLYGPRGTVGAIIGAVLEGARLRLGEASEIEMTHLLHLMRSPVAGRMARTLYLERLRADRRSRCRRP